MFRTDLLSIVRSLDTAFTATGICHTGYVDCLISEVGMEVVSLSKTCTVLYQNEVEK